MADGIEYVITGFEVELTKYIRLKSDKGSNTWIAYTLDQSKEEYENEIIIESDEFSFPEGESILLYDTYELTKEKFEEFKKSKKQVL